MKSTLTTLFILSIILVSCNNKQNTFKVTQIEKDGFTSLSYDPAMKLFPIIDSTFYYFTQNDFTKAFGAEYFRGDVIARTDYYNVRVILVDFKLVDHSEYEFILRTFSKDDKIIDSFELGSTVNGKKCEGVLNSDNTITRTCGGKDETFLINDLGKFVKK